MNPPGPEDAGPASAAGAAPFRTTHWSVVLRAGRESTPGAAEALERLCAAYWYPLYAFVRRRGHRPEDAQDLVQGFFERLLSRRDLAAVDPGKGRFRTFLLTALTHHLANEWDRSQARKRGGGLSFVSLEGENPEERYRHEPAVDATPEAIFERAWAERMLETVLARLRHECVADGRGDRFDALKGCLLGQRAEVSYVELARQLGTTEQGIKSAVHRLRQRFRDLFREEIAQTVDGEAEIEAELRHLVQVMTG